MVFCKDSVAAPAASMIFKSKTAKVPLLASTNPPRLACSLSPYGALLGLVAIFSPVKVTRAKKACTGCGICAAACPSNIPVAKKERIVSEECIGCWRCISQCRAGALEMQLPWRNIVVGGLLFSFLVTGLFVGGTIIGRATGHWHTAITQDEYVRLLGR